MLEIYIYTVALYIIYTWSITELFGDIYSLAANVAISNQKLALSHNSWMLNAFGWNVESNLGRIKIHFDRSSDVKRHSNYTETFNPLQNIWLFVLLSYSCTKELLNTITHLLKFWGSKCLCGSRYKIKSLQMQNITFWFWSLDRVGYFWNFQTRFFEAWRYFF